MRLRIKILIGFLIIATVLLLAEIWLVYQMNGMEASVENLLESNYQSINATRNMLIALEREDQAVLMLSQGKWDGEKSELNTADALFRSGIKNVLKGHLSPAKKARIDSIRIHYAALKNLWEAPVTGIKKEKNLDWYLTEFKPAVTKVKTILYQLIGIGNQGMYRASLDLKDRVHRIVMPGLVAILAAIIYLFIFDFFIDHYVIHPIVKITKGVRDLLELNKPFEVEVESKDEVAELASQITTLSSKSIFGETQE
ncbi:hypothetical protein BMS3Abin05_00305 [bacterium BMS3Abin05]|nr:hypothetical protein BMS3Abin05_00305 [bacterium BMS3Abin05]GBE28306.1 hypothetical protein BMS3Bbin03_02245 [bacterium BMS3Bbin03]